MSQHSTQRRVIILLAVSLLVLISFLLLRPFNQISANSHIELDDYNEFLEPNRVKDGSACFRFDLEMGREALSGAGVSGRYELHEIGTGRILAAWEAEADWVDSGWLYDIDSTFPDGSWVEAAFYPTQNTPNQEQLGVKLEILNPAADTDGYGWIKPGQCHAVELQFPPTHTYDQPILGDPPIILIAGSPAKDGATLPESAQPSTTNTASSSTAPSSTSSTATGSGSSSGGVATGSGSTTTVTPTATPAPTDEEVDTSEEQIETGETTEGETNTAIAEAEIDSVTDVWLIYINQFRAAANLPPVHEDNTLTEGSVWHSSYMVLNDKPIAHNEDPNNNLFNPVGDAAAEAGNIFATTQTDGQYNWAINFWFSAPFHSVAMLDPRLETVGYGDFVADQGTFKMAAVADVRTGLGPIPEGVTFPIFFPGPDSQTWVTRLSMDEWPNPYGNCPGYSRPSGPAMLVRLGDGSVTPRVTNAAFLNSAGEHLEICVFDETNYRNPVEYEQNLGRQILDVNDTVVIIPRRQLIVGERYEMYIEINGEIYDWFFDVVSPPELPTVEE